MSDDDQVNSMCAIYAHLIEKQLESDDPDDETVTELLGYIKQYCGTVPFAPGETPDHLEEHQFEPGDGAGENGTVVVDGKEIPASAAADLSPGD